MTHPQNIGIIGIEVYFPKCFILQSDLEKYDISVLGEEKRASIQGKYTNGLGQTSLSFCCDREDTVSIALSVVSSLLEKYNLKPSSFGRVEVGTETAPDRSKSIKSYLMQLFSDNPTVLGVDNTNACYGGTAAFFNSLAWIESSQWDGRLALVVCADIATYEDIRERPTGGVGAIAMALGPKAPIVVEPGYFFSWFAHSFDFYKPDFSSPTPIVNGTLSLNQYYECLDGCFMQLKKKSNLDSYDFICFHTPFINHIKKCTGRLFYLNVNDVSDSEIKETRSNPDFFREYSQKTKDLFEAKVSPSCTLSKFCGNGYTASLYMAVASLIFNRDVAGKRVLCFSYGSGAASSVFSLRIDSNLKYMKDALNLEERLAKRKQMTVADYIKSMSRAKILFTKPSFHPEDPLDLIWDNAFYFEGTDDKWKRAYSQLKNS